MTTRQLLRNDIRKWAVKIQHKMKTDSIHKIPGVPGLCWEHNGLVPCMDVDCGLCQTFHKPDTTGCTTCPLYYEKRGKCSNGHRVSPWFVFYVTQTEESVTAMIKILVKTLKELTPIKPKEK